MTADELTTNILNSEDLAQAIVKKFIDLDGMFAHSLSLSLSDLSLSKCSNKNYSATRVCTCICHIISFFQNTY